MKYVSCQESNKKACQMDKALGHCKALIPRFYYNTSTGHCEDFTYGGCGGNENNFKTRAECESLCKPNQDRGINFLKYWIIELKSKNYGID